MLDRLHLTEAELLSLKEVGKGALQGRIPSAHADLLVERKLIYRLLGSYRVTAAGSARIRTSR
jgi:hypothetical protein